MYRSSIAAAALALIFLSCSSAPKPTQEINNEKNQAAQYTEAGNTYFDQGNYPEAQRFFNMALDSNLSVYNAAGIVGSYNSLGKVYLAAGKLEAAESDFNTAYSLSKTLPDPNLLAESASNLGELLLAQGKADDALARFQEAVAKVSDSQSVLAGRVFHNLGAAYKELGQWSESADYLNRALAIHAKLNRIVEAASDYYMLASTFSKQGDYAQAQKFAELALSSDQRMENSPGIASDLLALGIIAEKSGNAALAYDRLKASFEVYRTIGSVDQVKDLLRRLVQVATTLGLAADAAAYSQALKKIEAAP